MSMTLLIAAGLVAGATVGRGRRQHRKNHSWLTASAASGSLLDIAPDVSPDVSPVGPTQATISQRESRPAFFALDRLEQIAGFEPLYARRLNQSGILTYGEMAGLSPAALQSMVAPNGPFNLPVEQWLAQAGRLAGEAEML